MNELWVDKIEAYLDGKMTPEEQSGFESEMSANEELASALRIYHTIETEMRSQQKDKISEASLRQTLEEAGLRHFNGAPADTSETISGRPGTIIKIPSRRILAVAAAVLVIFVLSGILYFFIGNNRTKMVTGKDHPGTGKRDKDAGAWVKSPDKPSKQQDVPITSVPVQDAPATNTTRLALSHAEQERIFASNFRPDKIPKDRGGLEEDELEEELELYKNKNYKDAITALEEAKTDNSRGRSNIELKIFYNEYYLALSYMADHRVEKAIPELESALKESPDGFSKSKTQWYLALAYLKKGEWVKAEKLLNELAGSKKAGKYKGKAAKLIERVEKDR